MLTEQGAELLSVLSEDPGRPRALAVLGVAGSGKSSLLSQVRKALREAGLRVATHTRVPVGDCDALVVDDLDLLTEPELRTVAGIVDGGAHVVVAATRPTRHSAALRPVLAALTREYPPIRLAPLTSAEIEAELSAEVGITDRRVAATLHTRTAGRQCLVAAAVAALRAGIDVQGLEAVTGNEIRERLYEMDPAEVAVLALATLDVPIGATEVCATLGVDAGRAAELLDAARCSGFAGGPEAFVAEVHRQVIAVLGRTRVRDIEVALRDLLAGAGGVSDRLAAQLSSDGVDRSVDSRLEGVRLQVLAGDLRSATETIDALWGRMDRAQSARSVEVASVIAIVRGDAPRAARLYAWLADAADGGSPMPAGGCSRIWAIVDATAGDARRIRGLGDGADGQVVTPRLAAQVEAMTARGLAESFARTDAAALHTLICAAALERDCSATRLCADTAAATAALLALHRGQASRARTVLTRTPADALPPIHRLRRRILLAWVTLFEGDVAAAAREVEAVARETTGQAHTGQRDILTVAALRVAVARRKGDAGTLRAAWDAAIDPLGEYTPDLFGLLFVGELWVAAAQLGKLDEMTPTVERITAVLAGIGDAPQWSAAVHWYGVHAAIAGRAPNDLVPHARALAEAGRADPQAAVLARAGRVWVNVLGGEVDPDQVEEAARTLDEFGYTWDGARLAGQAALIADDPRVGAAMLQVARSLRTYRQPVAADDAEAERKSSVAVLSEREREVATLLLSGITYKGIGERLFISAKTVEHHVARIRQRIGAQSRAEMLAMLRAMKLGDELSA
ncbi:helix-turn-helix transcriptional regulator [Gordonia sp. NB41Y]|uniref:helix-turn-helix transcriptional regulator n=1 Tax=Gordonia sp. NB41Y TaxID=875808 RepID=UPI00128F58F6|nr:helix-turn-helix transcriptional regulator [Gordonia sp. NB41Y]WLP89533.1 LuxR C-terminal-related transcriptional regulator [Gordonia sp. NB41Y]